MQDMQRMAAAADAMVKASGVPPTAENYNRAIQAVMRGEAAPSDGFDMNAQVDRVMQRSTPRRANVPRNTQPNAVVGASGTAPDEGAVPDMSLPMPAPDVRQAARETAQPITFIPGEGEMYPPLNANPASTLDGGGMTNRLLRDLAMGAESAGAVSGAMPQVGAAFFNRIGLPNIRLGMNRPALSAADDVARLEGPDAASSVVAGAPRPTLPGSGGAQVQLPAPQQALSAPPSMSAQAGRVTPTAEEIASLPPAMQRALAGPDLPPGLPTGLSRMQRATMMGPGEAGNAAATAARASAAPKPRNMSAAQRQRRQNIAESP
jgi:hypothetical protein